MLATLLALTVALAAATAAAAATSGTVSVSSTVQGGSTLSVAPTGTPSFGITLDGTDQTTGYTLPVSVVDARGTGGGWNLTITSTRFDDGTGLGAGHFFPNTASTITAATSATCGTNSTCTSPSNNVSNSSLAVPAGATVPAPVKFFNAQANTGLGTMNVSATVSVSIPANVFAGTYSSTVTVAIAAGP